GERKALDYFREMVAQLKADDLRVRFHAAMALAKLGKVDAVPPVLDMLRDNADKDAYLRHAGVMVLLDCADRETLLAVAKDRSPAVRMAALLTMRRQGSAEAARFLGDPEPKLVLEAARAINDAPIN